MPVLLDEWFTRIFSHFVGCLSTASPRCPNSILCHPTGYFLMILGLESYLERPCVAFKFFPCFLLLGVRFSFSQHQLKMLLFLQRVLASVLETRCLWLHGFTSGSTIYATVGSYVASGQHRAGFEIAVCGII